MPPPLVDLGYVREQRGDLRTAEALYRRALATARRTLPPGHPARREALERAGRLLLATDRPEGAQPLLRELLELRRAHDEAHALTGETRDLLRTCLLRLGRFEEAEQLMPGVLPHCRCADSGQGSPVAALTLTTGWRRQLPPRAGGAAAPARGRLV